ncbi:MAG: hypothetical protein CL909_04095 [Deltaproteobacteria bacterium]|nr:hypothetical protein [Deltaproteobacteria bacterium]
MEYFFNNKMIYYSGRNRKKVIILSVLFVAAFSAFISAEEKPLNIQTTAVRYVFTQSVERALHPWLQEEVADNWFESNIPKSCHICDNVYRYPTDNGSVLTRGVQNMINRKRLATILEVEEFLTVIVRQSGEVLSVEASLHNLEQEEPLWAKVFEWSKPWSLW